MRIEKSFLSMPMIVSLFQFYRSFGAFMCKLLMFGPVEEAFFCYVQLSLASDFI